MPCFIAAQVEIYSASQDDRVIIYCFFDLKEISATYSRNSYPSFKFWDSMHPAQSESEYPTRLRHSDVLKTMSFCKVPLMYRRSHLTAFQWFSCGFSQSWESLLAEKVMYISSGLSGCRFPGDRDLRYWFC